MNFLEQIGERIRAQRELKGYTGPYLARACGISAGLLYKIEKGHHMPPYSLYEDLCREMGVSFRNILKGFHWTYRPLVGEGQGRQSYGQGS